MTAMMRQIWEYNLFQNNMSELRKMYINQQEASIAQKSSMARGEFEEMQKYFYDYPELNKFKKDIQWDVFWSIVDEFARKSGIKPKNLNRLNPSTIVGIKDCPPPRWL